MPQFAVPVAAEAAVATTMTAAEIAAAQAAATHAAQVTAAQVLAAEQAAALAAQQATAAAATNTAAATATNAATNQSVLNAIGAGGAPVSTAGGVADLGFKSLAQEVGAKTGIETVFQNAVSNTPSMSGSEFLNNSLAGLNTPFNPVTNVGTPLSQLIPATPSLPSVAAPAVPNAVVPDPMTYFDPAQPFANPTYASAAPPAPPAPPAVPAMAPPAAPASAAPTQIDYGFRSGLNQGVNAPLNTAQPSQYALGDQYGNYNLAQSVPSPAATATANPAPSGIESLFNKGVDYVKQNPLTALMGANTAYNALNKPEPEEKKKYKSTFNRNTYQAYNPVQPTPYRDSYAVGGLADLGGYSDGGRMLKGPGDGMSDDIPATIANKQPARLANEEFVIPADVVSHLGNGSSEAGAKQLYKMMERVRKARTGNKKQGKQINPDKYLA